MVMASSIARWMVAIDSTSSGKPTSGYIDARSEWVGEAEIDDGNAQPPAPPWLCDAFSRGEPRSGFCRRPGRHRRGQEGRKGGLVHFGAGRDRAEGGKSFRAEDR